MLAKCPRCGKRHHALAAAFHCYNMEGTLAMRDYIRSRPEWLRELEGVAEAFRDAARPRRVST